MRGTQQETAEIDNARQPGFQAMKPQFLGHAAGFEWGAPGSRLETLQRRGGFKGYRPLHK